MLPRVTADSTLSSFAHRPTVDQFAAPTANLILHLLVAVLVGLAVVAVLHHAGSRSSSRWRPSVRTVGVLVAAAVVALSLATPSTWAVGAVASVAGFLVGVLGETDDWTDDFTYAPLFESTTDAVAVLEFGPGVPIIRRANEPFAATFGVETDDLRDTPSDEVLDPTDADGGCRDRFLERARAGESFETRTRCSTPRGEREFVVRVVPAVERADATVSFVVLTDVTKHDQLAAAHRERARLTELLGTTTRMTNASNTAAAYDLLVDSLLDIYDYDAVSLSVDGDIVRQRGPPRPVCPEQLEQAVARDAPEVVRDVAGTTDRSWDRVVTVPIGDVGAVQVGTVSADTFDQPSVSAVEFVGAHLEETLEKLRRERRLTQERESMEFLHRLLRHHLLNGLNLVQARLNLLARTDDVDEDHFQTIERRVTEMIDRVQTIRALSEVLTDDEEYEHQAVDVAPVVDRQVSAAREIYQLATIDVDGEIPDVAVHGDHLLGEVVDNLLTNAIQHNDEPNPEIRLSATAHGDVFRLRIADNGPGIDDGRRERIFEQDVTSLDADDHGLGLYLVREVVDVYGGDIRVEDSDLGGAAFVVDLPITSTDSSNEGDMAK